MPACRAASSPCHIPLTPACTRRPAPQVSVGRWLSFCSTLVSRPADAPPRIAPCAVDNWRAVEALLRLLPSLPHQPHQLPGGRWGTAAEAVGAEGGLQRSAASGALVHHNAAVLALGALHVGQLLLRTPLPEAEAADAGAAQAAFELLSTACRAVHFVTPGLQPGASLGNGTHSCFLQRNDLVDLLRLLDAAAGLALRTGAAVLPTLADARQRAAAERCGAGAG